MKIYRKKSLQNTCPIFTNSLALCGIIWSTLACRVALYNQDTTTQSLFFLKTLKSRQTAQPRHELQTTTKLWTADCAPEGGGVNSASKLPQMAAPNRMLFSESFHATQTRVQLMYVIVHTLMYRHKLLSGLGLGFKLLKCCKLCTVNVRDISDCEVWRVCECMRTSIMLQKNMGTYYEGVT
jgi:hypothetical protein